MIYHASHPKGLHGTVTGPDSLNLMVGLEERGFSPEPDRTFHLITPRGTLLVQERYDTGR